MKNYLLSILFIFALAIGAFGQTNLNDLETLNTTFGTPLFTPVSTTVYLDFEDVKDPLIEPFDLGSYESAVANPDGDGFVAKVVKGGAFWGGINIYFGGDVTFTGTDDSFTVDFWTDATVPENDTITFTMELFNRTGGVTTIAADAYYTDADDTDVEAWKTLEFAIPDGTTGSYNQMVIFFGWQPVVEGDIVYFDNVVGPVLAEYGDADVTFTIEDKFNNATDVGLFIDGAAATLAQSENMYTNTTTLAGYSVLTGLSVGSYEIVFTHMANGTEVRDTSSLFVGSATGAQEVLQIIIVEAPEDGTANAISVGDTPPVIDGTIDDVWANAKSHSLQERSWWGSPSGLYSTFKIMWDIDNVYLLYVIEDATPYNGNTNNYENDCMETFFDMNQSAGTPYDADDFQIRTIRGLDTWTGSANVEAAGWADDIERAQVEMTDGVGYHIEMAIPWTTLSSAFLPIAGTEFNYDCSSADVGADGGPRLFREAWTTAADVGYFNTEFFGTITLSAETSEVSVQEMQIANLVVYPNPVIDRLNIKADSDISEINIFDITGREVSTLSNINSSFVTMSTDNLFVNGIYIVKVTDINGNTSARKITIQ